MPGPFATALVPAAISAAGAFFGQERQSYIDRREAEKNRQFQAGEAALNRSFQERMRNTEWQAALADMEAAGVNPALAYARGGASSPGGAMASGSLAAPARDSVGSAMAAIRMRKDLELMTESIRKTSAEADAAHELSIREKARNVGFGISEKDGSLAIDYSLPGLVQMTKAEVAERMATAARAGSMAEIAGIGGGVARGFQEVMPAFQRIMGVAGSGADSIAGVISFMERVARMRDDTVKSMFGVSREVVSDMLGKLRGRDWKDEDLSRIFGR